QESRDADVMERERHVHVLSGDIPPWAERSLKGSIDRARHKDRCRFRNHRRSRNFSRLLVSAHRLVHGRVMKPFFMLLLALFSAAHAQASTKVFPAVSG